jgi:hypothetical protein
VERVLLDQHNLKIQLNKELLELYIDIVLIGRVATLRNQQHEHGGEKRKEQ